MCFTHQRVATPTGLYWLLLIISTLLANPALAADIPSRSKPFSAKLHRITIKTIDNQKITGILYAVTDSSLLVCDRDHQSMRMLAQGRVPTLKTIAADQILKLRIIPVGNLVTSTIGGGVVGFLIMFSWEAKQHSLINGELMILNASVGGLFALLGFISSLKNIHKLRIDKSLEQFLVSKPLLGKYAAQ